MTRQRAHQYGRTAGRLWQAKAATTTALDGFSPEIAPPDIVRLLLVCFAPCDPLVHPGLTNAAPQIRPSTNETGN
jgi:hypothetical protein